MRYSLTWLKRITPKHMNYVVRYCSKCYFLSNPSLEAEYKSDHFLRLSSHFKVFHHVHIMIKHLFHLPLYSTKFHHDFHTGDA